MQGLETRGTGWFACRLVMATLLKPKAHLSGLAVGAWVAACCTLASAAAGQWRHTYTHTLKTKLSKQATESLGSWAWRSKLALSRKCMTKMTTWIAHSMHSMHSATSAVPLPTTLPSTAAAGSRGEAEAKADPGIRLLAGNELATADRASQYLSESMLVAIQTLPGS